MPAPKWPPSLRPYRGKFRVRYRGREYFIEGNDPNSQAVQTAYARLLAEIAAGVTERVPGDQITVSEVCVAFVERYAERRYVRDDGSGTPTGELKEYRYTIRDLVDLYGDVRVSQFGCDQLRAVRQRMIDAGKCRSLINKRVRRIVFLFGWAAGDGLLSAGLVGQLRELRPLGPGDAPDRPAIKPVPVEIVEATIEHLSELAGVLVRFILEVGCRPGEAQGLTVGQLRDAKTVEGFRLVPLVWHKTRKRGHDRTLIVSPQAFRLVAEMLTEDRGDDGYLFSPRWQLLRWGKAVGSGKRRPGERYYPTSFAKAIHKACQAAEVESWHPHQLRHTAADRLERLHGYEVARTILGHRSLDATRIYAPGSVERAIEALKEN